MKEGLKTLKMSLEIKGRGLVNYNGNEPNIHQRKKFFNELVHNGKICENVSFAKENVYKEKLINKEGKEEVRYTSKKVISKGLLRKTIIGLENDVNSDQLTREGSDLLRVNYISQNSLITKGYCILNKAKGISLKRASALCTSDAEQTNNAETIIEICTTEGIKDNTSLFYRETCGYITYQADVYINIKQLQFISMDDNYDRAALLESDFEIFSNNIKRRGGSVKKGKFITSHDNLVGEYGIVLSDNIVYKCVRDIMEKILSFNIKRAGSYAEFASLHIIIGNDKIEIKTITDFDKLGLYFNVDFKEICEDKKVEATIKELVQ